MLKAIQGTNEMHTVSITLKLGMRIMFVHMVVENTVGMYGIHVTVVH